jgi:hypothetical protein
MFSAVPAAFLHYSSCSGGCQVAGCNELGHTAAGSIVDYALRTITWYDDA